MKNKVIRIEKSAQKFISKQPREQQIRLLKAIELLPDEGDIRKMQGFKSRYRLRVGDFRIQYTVNRDDLTVTVTVVDTDNRGQAYK